MEMSLLVNTVSEKTSVKPTLQTSQPEVRSEPSIFLPSHLLKVFVEILKFESRRYFSFLNPHTKIRF